MSLHVSFVSPDSFASLSAATTAAAAARNACISASLAVEREKTSGSCSDSVKNKRQKQNYGAANIKQICFVAAWPGTLSGTRERIAASETVTVIDHVDAGQRFPGPGSDNRATLG